jgi:hypothetical protein
MYGVLSTTPPQRPATSVQNPSVMRIPRVSYSSPAAAALSVLSMPPMIVMTPNGRAIGRYAHASDSPPRNSRLGQGSARRSATGDDAAAGAGPCPKPRATRR